MPGIMFLFVLCSLILVISIETNGQNPVASVELQENGNYDQNPTQIDSPRFGKIFNRHIVNPTDDYLINKLARQYLAMKTLEKQNIPNNCDVFGYRRENIRNPTFENSHSFNFGVSSPFSEPLTNMKFWNTLNLRGQLQLPLFVEEPDYMIVRREMDSKELAHIPEEFIPQRGRREFDEKRNSMQDLLKQEEFFPNRGKKFFKNSNLVKFPQKTKKKAKFDDVLNADLFFPNRGKKQWNAKYNHQNEESIRFPKKIFEEYVKSLGKRSKMELDLNDFFVPNRGKKKQQLRGLDILDNDDFFPNRGKRNVQDINHNLNQSVKDKMEKDKGKLTRTRRDLIDNLSKESKDTFYLARGRRGPQNQTNEDFGDTIVKQQKQREDINHIPDMENTNTNNLWNDYNNENDYDSTQYDLSLPIYSQTRNEQ